MEVDVSGGGRLTFRLGHLKCTFRRQNQWGRGRRGYDTKSLDVFGAAALRRKPGLQTVLSALPTWRKHLSEGILKMAPMSLLQKGQPVVATCRMRKDSILCWIRKLEQENGKKQFAEPHAFWPIVPLFCRRRRPGAVRICKCFFLYMILNMIHDIWYMIYDTWYMIHDIWYMIYMIYIYDIYRFKGNPSSTEIDM